MAAKINYTYTDEAPMLATYSFLPIIRAFLAESGVTVENSDISVAGRVIANFPEKLKPGQKIPDILTQLGELSKTPDANIIKLPNISASIPQLKECIAELKAQGYDLPEYPEDPKTDEEKEVKAKYAKVLGSAVNPVLREGNSDRRVASAVKKHAQRTPPPVSMKAWSGDSKTHVASMSKGDFFSNEKSVRMEEACTVKVELAKADGSTQVLKEKIALQAGEVLDATFMSKAALREFLEGEMQDAKAKGILFSLHMKATMMKISDPIIFGHCVTVYYKEVFAKHAATFEKLGVNANNGLGDVYDKIASLPEAERKQIEEDIMAVYESRPRMAMVNSDKGITNLHVPSDIIIDASMPPMVRDGGKMWSPDSKPGARDSKLEEVKCTIPDRCYAGMYQKCVEFCKVNGQFDTKTMGNVCNVGLMAQKAEEYGSHPNTFQIPAAGTVRVVKTSGGGGYSAGGDNVVFEHKVEEGDIWRACQTKDAPIKDWVRLAVSRARLSNTPAIFWLNPARAHDTVLKGLVEKYMKDHDTAGLDIKIMTPEDAIWESMTRAKAGQNTISVTGNVLRDYLTDLFPILELGTSAKMLSIVPLLQGGGLYETGAGGSAPKHVEQFVDEGHLRWDSLGEFLALAVCLEDIGVKSGDEKIQIFAETLHGANEKFLETDKNPGRKVKQLDTRGSHFYLALYWAQGLAAQDKNKELKAKFAEFAKTVEESEKTIVDEFINCQGEKMDIGGYYHPDHEKSNKLMRPSTTFNGLLSKLSKGLSDSVL